MWLTLILQTGFQRQTSYDRVRKIVQEEGRAARNLVTWNVPLDEQVHGSAGKFIIEPLSLYSIYILHRIWESLIIISIMHTNV